MATVIDQNRVKLNSGQTVQAQTGGWYDGQQFWGGTLSQPGQINTQSNQPGAGQAVSQEVIAQTSPANVAYVQQQRQQAGLTPSPVAGVPASQPTQQPTQQLTPGSAVPGGTSGAGVGFTAPEAINLPQLYEGLYASSGVRDIEADLSAKTMAYNEQVAKIKDNPYLSEATMTGRISKLDQKFGADKLALQNNIAMRKADIETQLNLQTKQFDINSQVAKTAFDQFTSLLSAGALENASGEDIANITRATGVSSAMIQSAVNAKKQKDIQTQIVSYDDGENQGFAVINSNTGEIINKQQIAVSKPKAASVVDQRVSDEQQTQQNAIGDVKRGVTLKDLIGHYGIAGGLTIEELYRLYNSYTAAGPAKESLDQIKRGIYVDTPGFEPEQ